MTVEPELLRLVADHDQDRARAERWWAEATFKDKLRVWLCIQRDYPHPTMEVMSRFAQLAFNEMILAQARQEAPP
jgi:hypothetical protein